MFSEADVAGSVDDAGAESDAGGPARYSLIPSWQLSTENATGYVDVDAEGNLIFVGNFAETLEIEGASHSSAGGIDIVIAAIDRVAGSVSASERFGGVGTEFATDISVGSDGRIAVVGGAGGFANVGGNNFGASQASNTFDGFVATYSPGLAHIWSVFANSSVDDVFLAGVSADTGATLVCGRFVGELTLAQEGGEAISIPSVDGHTSVFSQYAREGGFSGNNQIAITGNGTQRCETVVGDGVGANYVAGAFSETLSFGGLGDDLEADLGNTDLFVAHVGHQQSLQWLLPLTGNTFTTPTMHSAATADGALVLTTQFQDSLVLPGGQPALETSGVEDIALLSFAADDGEVLIAKSFPSTGSDRANDIAIGPDGEIAIVGRFTLDIDFGGGTISSNGASDVFVVVFDADGEHLWSRGIGGAGTDTAQSVAFDDEGSLYICARHGGSIDFGLGPIAGTDQAVVVKFAREE